MPGTRAGSPCDPWPLLEGCLPSGWSVDPTQWTPQQADAVAVATALLWRATAGVYGLCTVTLRPCRWRKYPVNKWPYMWAMGWSPWVPTMWEGRIYNYFLGCMCQGACGCGPICEVKLDPPVYDVTQVKIDGAVVDPTTYWVNDNHGLIRKKDTGCWPMWQTLDLPDTEPDTWSVTYRRGILPAVDGQMALTLLAVETAKACGGSTCTLSPRVSRVVREGITFERLAPLTEFGIDLVDRWVASVNPYNARAPMRAWSPDTVRGRRQTWPTP